MKLSLFRQIIETILHRIHNKTQKIELQDILLLSKSAIGMEYNFVENKSYKNINQAIFCQILKLDENIKNMISWEI